MHGRRDGRVNTSEPHKDHKSKTIKGTLTVPCDANLRSFTVRYVWIQALTGERRVASEILGVLMGFHKKWTKQPPLHKDDKHCWNALPTHALARFTGSSDTRVKEALKYLKSVGLIHVHVPESSSGRTLRKHIALNVEKLNAAVSWINTNGGPCVCIPGPDNDSVFVPYFGKASMMPEEIEENAQP